jgi:hypothetical protein
MTFSSDENNGCISSKGPFDKLQPNDQTAKSPLRKQRKNHEIKPQLHKGFYVYKN